MPRIGEIIPQPATALMPYLSEGKADAVAEVCESLNQFDPAPFGIIPDFLTDGGLALLEQLDVPENGKCSNETLEAHMVAGPLAETMARISLSNLDLRHESTRTVHSLRNETGKDLVVEPHRDLLDGHAVLFNFAVTGDIVYILDGVEYELKSNGLVVLNGAAVWGDITDYLPGNEDSDPRDGWRSLGGVTAAHSVIGTGLTSRNRLLVYADGPETRVTQIPAQLPPWF